MVRAKDLLAAVEELDVKVTKSMSDDDIRDALPELCERAERAVGELEAGG